MIDFTKTWLSLLHSALYFGYEVSPRGMLTRELPQHTIAVNMRKPVLKVPARKLNYKFMAAEAYWIVSGDNKVKTIAPYNPNIAKFSDDGVKFFGAYGPKILAQLHYVVDKLLEDRDSRQAGLTIWRENPPVTKDVPCTVAMFFNIRQSHYDELELNAHVFMRSSDIWLGVPYDVFNFCMVAYLVCGYLNTFGPQNFVVKPGTLHLTAASSHIYESNWEAAKAIINSVWDDEGQQEAPATLWQSPKVLLRALKDLRETSPGSSLRWWEAADAS
jgi:thymidylate synthase